MSAQSDDHPQDQGGNKTAPQKTARDWTPVKKGSGRLLRFSWIVLPLTTLGVGWGVGQTFVPQIHIRVFEWTDKGYISFNPMPQGGFLGLGILIMMCIAWVFWVHKNTRRDNATANELKWHENICIVLSGVFLLVLGWKLQKGTLSYWFLPSLVASLVAVFLANDNANVTLAARSFRRGTGQEE
jgi:hypothetical protein